MRIDRRLRLPLLVAALIVPACPSLAQTAAPQFQAPSTQKPATPNPDAKVNLTYAELALLIKAARDETQGKCSVEAVGGLLNRLNAEAQKAPAAK